MSRLFHLAKLASATALLAANASAAWRYVPEGGDAYEGVAYITDGNWVFQVSAYNTDTKKFTTVPKAAGCLAGEGALDLDLAERELAESSGVDAMTWTLQASQFNGLTNLTDIALSSKQTWVPQFLCNGCTALTNANCRGLLTLNNYAFKDCKSLASFSPDFWTQDEPYPFKEECFAGCSSLPFDTLRLHPNSSMGWRCFRSATGIRTVDYSRRTGAVDLGFVMGTGVRKVILPPAQSALSCENYFNNIEELYATSNLITSVSWAITGTTSYHCRFFVDPVLEKGYLEPTLAGYDVDSPSDEQIALYCEKYGVAEEQARRDLIGLWNFKRGAQGLVWIVRYVSPFRPKNGTMLFIQ
ncbi:MAG: leucine-rich repeat protein [Kiritimatiellia bacterium]